MMNALVYGGPGQKEWTDRPAAGNPRSPRRHRPG